MKHYIITNEQLEKIVNEMAYPSSFNMDEFKQIPNFAKRVRYCDDRLEYINSGSSRVVCKIDDTKVLKLAKNTKGIEQNKNESNQNIQNEFSIVAKTFDIGENYNFVEMELAMPCKASYFKQIIGFDFANIWAYLHNVLNDSKYYTKKFTPEVKTEMDDNEWLAELLELVSNYSVSIGDLGRTSTYGLVYREGKPEIVVIDFGLTDKTYDDYYK